MAGPLMVISDAHLPTEHKDALPFCEMVKKDFGIPDENMVCIGDITDQYFGGMWKKSPDARSHARLEVESTVDKLKMWYSAFPKMRCCIGNHDNRWWRKALDAEIPSQLLRGYREVIQAPRGWKFDRFFKVKTKGGLILFEHGDNYGGMVPHRIAAMNNGINTVIGHHHTKAGVEHVKTRGMSIWGMSVGCLIDFDQYAFDYARKAKELPVLGVGLILNEGRTPLFLPM